MAVERTCDPGFLKMLPYQAMAMDYAVTSSFQRHPGNAVNMNMNMNMNPAFTHSWFMPADLCVPFKPSQPLLEPGHVFIFVLALHFSIYIKSKLQTLVSKFDHVYKHVEIVLETSSREVFG